MPKVMLLKGLPASGKSTWAKETVARGGGNWARINKDDLRRMMHDGLHSRVNERQIKAARDALIVAMMDRGINVIVDDTNFAASHATRVRQLIDEHNTNAPLRYSYEEKFFDVKLDVAIERDLGRPHPVGATVITTMYHQFLRPPPPVYPIDPALDWAVICDVDGTLAHFEHHRGPYDHMECTDDVCDDSVRHLLRLNSGDMIVLMSGRKEESRELTTEWLDTHEVPWDILLMRATDDNRKDTIVKKELFNEHLRGRFNIRYVLDDRDQVVRMWREELGLKVLQVAEGAF